MSDDSKARRRFRIGFCAIPPTRIEPAVRAFAHGVRAQKPAK